MVLVGIGGIVILFAILAFGTGLLTMGSARPLVLGGLVLLAIGMISVLIIQSRNFAAAGKRKYRAREIVANSLGWPNRYELVGTSGSM